MVPIGSLELFWWKIEAQKHVIYAVERERFLQAQLPISTIDLWARTEA